MNYSKKEKHLTGNNSTGKEMPLMVKQILSNPKENEISVEQLNEHLVNLSMEVRERVRVKRLEFQKGKPMYVSDIVSPYCHIKDTLLGNIDNVLACFENTLLAALFCESKYVEYMYEHRKLIQVKERENKLIFDFLSENGLTQEFNDYVEKSNSKSTKNRTTYSSKYV